MSWTISYRSSVEKDLARLPQQVRVLMLKKFVELGDNPFPSGCKKLKGAETQDRGGAGVGPAT